MEHMQINSQEQREQLKDQAVETRESGNLEQAAQMFEQITNWDEQNENWAGLADVYGHLRITHSRMGDAERNEDIKEKHYTQALEFAEKGLKTIQDHPELGEARMSVQQIHLASSKFALSKYLPEAEAQSLLETSLHDVNTAIENLGGSIAHKAWPSNLKAQILHRLNRTSEAVEALKQGELLIFEGYEEEMQSGDQAEIKLNVWLSGLHLTMAQIALEKNKLIIAKHYATSVLSIEDPNNQLGERKKEAQRILNQISNG
jgi:hypothetical protein